MLGIIGCPPPLPSHRFYTGRKSGWHGAQSPAQRVGPHIVLDVQGAVLALVVRQ